VSGTDLPVALRSLAAGLVDDDRLARFVGPRPGRGARAAAVLALLEVATDDVYVVVAERASTLRHHAGQLAFPGGGVEPEDVDLAATAVREAHEEVGLDPASVEVLGLLPAVHVAVSGFDVTAVAAWWRAPHPLTTLQPHEVAAVHRIAVGVLADPDTRVQVQHPSGYTGPGFVVADPVRQAEGAAAEPLLIWGLTAHLLDGVLELAGWARPWDHTRTAGIPARYLTDRRPDPPGGPDAH
jgi:8-oxo-dGTP pyrophosphatase MutT (NUDIX family)